MGPKPALWELVSYKALSIHLESLEKSLYYVWFTLQHVRIGRRAVCFKIGSQG